MIVLSPFLLLAAPPGPIMLEAFEIMDEDVGTLEMGDARVEAPKFILVELPGIWLLNELIVLPTEEVGVKNTA